MVSEPLGHIADAERSRNPLLRAPANAWVGVRSDSGGLVANDRYSLLIPDRCPRCPASDNLPSDWNRPGHMAPSHHSPPRRHLASLSPFSFGAFIARWRSPGSPPTRPGGRRALHPTTALPRRHRDRHGRRRRNQRPDRLRAPRPRTRRHHRSAQVRRPGHAGTPAATSLGVNFLVD